MKSYLALLIVLIGLASCTKAQNSLQPSPHDMVFEELAGSWDEGIPLGNGMMGALVWHKEEYTYKWVQKNWEEKNYRKVQQAFDGPYDQSAGPSKIPVAALEIPLDGYGPVESVRLYTHHGLCVIQWKSGVSMEIFVHPEDPVGWFRITTAPADTEIKLAPPPYTLGADPSSRNRVTGGQDLNRLGYPES